MTALTDTLADFQTIPLCWCCPVLDECEQDEITNQQIANRGNCAAMFRGRRFK